MNALHAKMKFYTFVAVIVVCFAVLFALVVKKSRACNTPEKFSTFVFKVYVKTLKNAVQITPPVEGYSAESIVEDNPQQTAKVTNKLEKLRKKNVKKLQKCAIDYHHMEASLQKQARSLTYQKVTMLYKSNIWNTFTQSLETNPSLSKNLFDIRRITRYAFIKPYRHSVNNKKNNNNENV